MILKSGNRVKVIDRKKNVSGDATILSAGEREFSLTMLSNLELNPGDEIELEASKREDALYIIRASVLGTGKDGSYNLKQLGEEQRWQRRKSERIPVNYRAEYILLDKICVNSFQEARILNISRGGALLEVKTPLQLMSELQLFFEIPLNRGEEVSTGMKGKVVREHLPAEGADLGEWQYSYGIEFEEPFAALSV
jgi:c-di-GMP-binding flagellar brake protein YcgR